MYADTIVNEGCLFSSLLMLLIDSVTVEAMYSSSTPVPRSCVLVKSSVACGGTE